MGKLAFMTHLSFLDYLPLWGVFVATVVMIALSMEVGFRIGSWRRRHSGLEKDAPVGALVGATLALLGFMLATTFGIAVSRFDLRLNTFLDEVEAISTALLRAEFLSNPIQRDVKKALGDYIDARLAATDPTTLNIAIARSEELHHVLWDLTIAAERSTANQVTAGLFIESINEIIDLHTRRVIAAVGARIPGIVWMALYAVTIFGMGELGYQAALAGSARSPATVGLILSFTLILWIIVDLDRPFEGALTVSQAAMRDLQRSLNKDPS
jgi:hypothetical protein